MKQVDDARSKMREACAKLSEANERLLAIAGPVAEAAQQPTPFTFVRAARQQLGEATSRLTRLIGA